MFWRMDAGRFLGRNSTSYDITGRFWAILKANTIYLNHAKLIFCEALAKTKLAVSFCHQTLNYWAGHVAESEECGVYPWEKLCEVLQGQWSELEQPSWAQHQPPAISLNDYEKKDCYGLKLSLNYWPVAATAQTHRQAVSTIGMNWGF